MLECGLEYKIISFIKYSKGSVLHILLNICVIEHYRNIQLTSSNLLDWAHFPVQEDLIGFLASSSQVAPPSENRYPGTYD